MPNDVVHDVPRGNMTMRYGPLRQRQPGSGPAPEDLGVSTRSYPERTRQLRRDQQRRAGVRPNDTVTEGTRDEA
jgi:hypothetical protein